MQSALSIAKSAAIFVVYNLIYGLASTEADLVAHIGGLLTGFAAGCFLARPLAPASQHLQLMGTVTVALVAAGLAFAGLAGLPKSGQSQQEWYRLTMVWPSVTVGTQDRVVYSGTATKEGAEELGRRW